MKEPDTLYIYCFSGTGNAKLSCGWIAEEAEKKGLKTVVQQIDRNKNIVLPSKEEKPLIGFAFPTHGFNAAPIMLRFIAGFPSRMCREVFLLNTRAGMKLNKIFLPGLSGIALIMPAFILMLKGYRCIGFRPVDLPSNWIPLHPGLRQKVIESIIARCEPIVRKFANKILSGRKVYRGLFSLPVDLLISPVAVGYYLAGRFFLSKTFIAGSRCNKCGICINQCPTGSIRMVSDRPYWKLTCESCMRCLNHCPERAIEAAHGMAALFILVITSVNAWLMVSLTRLLDIPQEAIWWKISDQIISAAVMVFTAALLYLIIHYLMGFRLADYLIRYTSLTSFRFWRRYKYLKDKKILNNIKPEPGSNN